MRSTFISLASQACCLDAGLLDALTSTARPPCCDRDLARRSAAAMATATLVAMERRWCPLTTTTIVDLPQLQKLLRPDMTEAQQLRWPCPQHAPLRRPCSRR
jgi:hypothetical protein